MNEQGINSNIEKAAEVEKNMPETASGAPKLFGALIDKEGWKKDAKKICCLLVALSVLVVAYAGLASDKGLLGWGVRWHAPLETVKYKTYEADGGFSFAYPERYVFDADQKRKFGADYLAGFHLEADSRTGCDVRSSEVGINFAKSDNEIAAAVSKQLAAEVKGFDEFAGKRIKLGGKDAFRSDFTLVDPLGNSLSITQVMVSAGKKNYLVVCGSGQAQAEFFKQDFTDFLRSFRFGA